MTDVAMLTLAEMYDRACRTPSDIYEHLPRFVEIVEETNAEHVVELGTRSGVSTTAWLYALEGRGRLTSVDIDPRPDLGDWPHWTFVQGNDVDINVVKNIEPADVVFIDTSHLYGHTKRELGMWQYRVKPGGRMVLHDTMLERPEGAPRLPRFPVLTAMNEFVMEHPRKWSVDPKCWGLGEIWF